MSIQDYMTIKQTRLADFHRLPVDLQARYLNECPKCVKHALTKPKDA